jgi:cysteine desulfurase
MRIGRSDGKTVIYLDHAATTPPLESALNAAEEVAREKVGNPSSLHVLGREAFDLLESLRARLLAALGAEWPRVGEGRDAVFTSGGTESDALAIIGGCLGRRRGNVVWSAVEHSAVADCGRLLQTLGLEVRVVEPDRFGRVDPHRFASMIDERTVVASLMHVNNEIGTVQQVAETSRLSKERNDRILFHTDGVQSLGVEPLSELGEDVDLASFSSHKIGGPRGVGALVVRKGLTLEAITGGGGQERGLRPGTENLAGIAGFVRAAEEAIQSRQTNRLRLGGLREAMARRVRDEISDARINGHPDEVAPHVLSVSVPGISSEALTRGLDERGVCVSHGAACHARKGAGSKVLEAVGVPKGWGTVRFSFSSRTERRDVEEAADMWVDVVKTYRI